MKQTLLHLQEIEVFYVIPTLRRYLAIAMKQRGMKQREIADLFSIEEAAVSQYLSRKRGNRISFDKPILKEISTSASRIVDRLSYIREMQRLVRLIKESGWMCRIHKQLSTLPSGCNPESVGCFKR